jgi:hypothetical protein
MAYACNDRGFCGFLHAFQENAATVQLQHGGFLPLPSIHYSLAFISFDMFSDISCENDLTVTQTNSYSTFQDISKSRKHTLFRLYAAQCEANSSKIFHKWVHDV